MIQRSRRFLRPRRFLSTTVPLSEPLSSEGKHVLFPWGLNPDRTKRGITAEIFTLINHHLLSNMKIQFIPEWDTHALRIYWSHEFMEGAEMALRAVSSQIFAHVNSRGKASPSSSSSASVPSPSDPSIDETDGVTPEDLEALMEKKLATFYLDAISAVRDSDYEVHHELISIDKASVGDCQLIVSGSRNQNLEGFSAIDWPFSFFGPVKVLRPSLQSMGMDFTLPDLRKTGASVGFKLEDMTSDISPEDIAKRAQTHAELMDRGRMLTKYATVRLGIDMKCTELFSVTDKKSGELIQGAKLAEERMHTVTMEAVYQLNSHTLEDWTVVDIDGWLDGNEFWENESSIIAKMMNADTEAEATAETDAEANVADRGGEDDRERVKSDKAPSEARDGKIKDN